MLERLSMLLLLWITWVPVAGACSSDDLFDLVAKRLGYMPAIARAKHALGKPVEDVVREAVVLEQSRAQAAAAGLPEAAVAEFMVAQMSVAKAIQRREPVRPADTIDGAKLLAEIRPQLSALGQLQLQSLACLRQRQAVLAADQFEVFSAHLESQQLPPGEAQLLFQRLQQILAAP